MNSTTGSNAGPSLTKWTCCCLLMISPLLLLATGMTLSWWIPGLFAWTSAGIYFFGVRTPVGVRIVGILLLTIASLAWAYGLLSSEDWSLISVYLFYPLLTIVAIGAALTDTIYLARKR